MNRRTAAQIRKGILAARDSELRQYVHLGTRLFREAARREAVRVEDRDWGAKLKAEQAVRNYNLPFPAHFDGFVYIETGDAFKDAANRLAIFGATDTIPQRVTIGIDPKEHA